LADYLIGAGGWAYFRIPGVHPLVAYSKAFNFVEVNSTFYQIPRLKEVENWRKLVPPGFQFSVRAHRSITHKYKLQLKKEAIKTFETMQRICKILNVDFLHLQTPRAVSPRDLVETLPDFLHSVNLGSIRLVLEIRGPSASKLPNKLVETMRDHNIIHCVDLSKGETPAYESDVLYSRLFGKGYHNIYQPTDEELREIDHKASHRRFEKVVLSFHFVRMYKDAARLKIYKETGKFPMVTRSTGLSSFEEVLREDARFPSTKQELISSQGWKLFDLNQDKRIHVKEYLDMLPERTYQNVSDVLAALSSILR